jgi:hypothetical protein
MLMSLLLAAAAASAPAQAGLAPFAAFAGHCWRGEAPGHAGIDTHCFEWVYGGQHLRDRHVVTLDGKPVYQGEALYSVERGKVTFTYWNSLGGLGRGTATIAGDDYHFAGTIHAEANSPEEEMIADWRKAPTSYEVREGRGGAPRMLKRTD